MNEQLIKSLGRNRGYIPEHIISLVKCSISKATVRNDITALKGWTDAIEKLLNLDFNDKLLTVNDIKTFNESLILINYTLGIFNILQLYISGKKVAEEENLPADEFVTEGIESYERKYIRKSIQCWKFAPLLVRIYNILISGTILENTYLSGIELVYLANEDGSNLGKFYPDPLNKQELTRPNSEVQTPIFDRPQ